MIKKKRYDLVTIIYHDLRIYGKWQLFVLLLILISSVLVVLVTYKTRCMIIYREQLFIERNVLDTEWRNLIAKEEILSNYDRIEYIAVNELKMHYSDLISENILD